jgi:hypothetical protein
MAGGLHRKKSMSERTFRKGARIGLLGAAPRSIMRKNAKAKSWMERRPGHATGLNSNLTPLQELKFSSAGGED